MCRKKIDKKIFFDILIKVGLKSREKIEKQGIISCYCPNKRKIQDNYMKNNGPCADIAGSAGEGLRKTKEEHQ